MAPARVTDVSVVRPDGRGLAGGFIDTPRPGDGVSAGRLWIVGWAVGASAAVVSIDVRYRGESLAKSPVDLRRPDVARFYPGQSQSPHSGYRVEVAIPGGPGDHVLELHAVLANGSRARLGTVSVIATADTPAVAAPTGEPFDPSLWTAPPGGELRPHAGEFGPDTGEAHPVPGVKAFGFLKNLVRNPNIVVGDYTYYADAENSENFERNVLYLNTTLGERLVIGKFCSLAYGVKFIMNGANHLLSGFSTYPFWSFPGPWQRVFPDAADCPNKGDTVIGNDVWIGYDAMILPGVRVGDGAVIATRAVVARDVPPFSIVAGNPARVVKTRFPDDVVRELLAIRWWDWPADKITRNLPAIVGADIALLRAGV